MQCLLTGAVVAAFASLALAQEAPTTLQNVTTRGIVIQAYGLDIPVSYTPDGKFSGGPPGQTVEGVWRIDGDKLCTRVAGDPEVCAVYPAGKKPGDVFDVEGALGPQLGVVKVTIR